MPSSIPEAFPSYSVIIPVGISAFVLLGVTSFLVLKSVREKARLAKMDQIQLESGNNISFQNVISERVKLPFNMLNSKADVSMTITKTLEASGNTVVFLNVN